ncbi:site-specific DNA-methyltransferase [Ruminococcaceae bacterium OttesenSCG-928-D13]|nr:site-specific DNA-methyltransferase [Ruminococcaceae bacterium OttesenSCG-928-D13]
MDKFDGQSMDIERADRDKLQSLFPQCFVEGKLDIDKLLNLCGEYMDNDFEKYKFEWSGKAECYRIAGKRSTGTLRPSEDESVNWDTTHNLYIEGDNLEALKLLQTACFRKVKMIYIDPPYNTGHDFVYEDDFRDPIARYKEVTQQTTKSNPETMGRYHTNWLNMMFPRLRLAANLLRDDGIIFISIDDAEVDNLKKLCNEVFGEENFVACLVYDKNRKNDAKYFSVGHEYMLVYFKSAATVAENGTIFRANKEGVDEVKAEFERLRKLYNDDWSKVNEGLKALYASWPSEDERKPLVRYTKVDEQGPYRDDGNINWPGSGGSHYDVMHPITGKSVKKPISGWRYSPERLQEEVEKGHVVFGPDETTVPRVRSNLFEADKQVMRSVHFSYAQTATQEFNKLFDGIRVFENPKSIDDIKNLISYVTAAQDNDIILDFFSGSATTAHAVMQLNAEDGGNRRFICVQLPEVCDENSEAFKAGYKNICEIGKERIRRAGTKIKEALAKDGGDLRHIAQNIDTAQQKLFLSDDGEQAFSVPIIPPRWSAADETDTNLAMANQLDIGFRCFKLDSSNLVAWDAAPISDGNLQTLWDRFDSLSNTLKAGRSDMDIVFEVMLKMGVPLDFPVRPITVGGKKVYSIGEDAMLLVCLDSGITPKDIEAMCDLAPAKIIAAEEGFADDTALSNAHYILKDRDIEMKLL